MQQCWDIVHHLHKWAHNICVLSEAADCAWKSAPVYMMMPRNVMLIMRLNQAMPKAYGQELNACITPCAEAMSFANPSSPPPTLQPLGQGVPPPHLIWGLTGGAPNIPWQCFQQTTAKAVHAILTCPVMLHGHVP